MKTSSLPARILFVRLAAIGDVIQAAAALRLFKESHPGVAVDWVLDSNLTHIVDCFNVVDHVIPVDSNALFLASFMSRMRSLLDVIRRLAKCGPYDTVYCAHPDWRFRLLTLLVQCQHRISPKNLARGQGFLASRNRVFEYYRLLTGVDRGSLAIDSALSGLGKSLLATDKGKLFSLPSHYYVLIPGGAKNALRDDPLRRWPTESYRELAKVLLRQNNTVVLLGGQGDSWVSEYFKGVDVIDLIGQTTLNDMVALLDNAKCAVAHDSGPIHLAAITSVPLVGIFGPTPANAVLSFSRPRTIILHPENRVACSPCYDGRGYSVCDANFCMEETSVENVLLAVNSLAHG